MEYPTKEKQALKQAINEVKKLQKNVEITVLKEKLATISKLLAAVQV